MTLQSRLILAALVGGWAVILGILYQQNPGCLEYVRNCLVSSLCL